MNIPEPVNPGFPEVYLLDVNDDVLGGEDGVSNRQAKQLVERTARLKGQADSLQEQVDELIENGLIRLTAITVTHLPDKTAYLQDAPFIPDGLVVQGVFSDGSRQQMYPENPPAEGVSGYVLSQPDMASLGPKEITVTYQGKTASFTVTVYDEETLPVLTGITLAALPSKLVYETGETLDLSGLAVKANYSDGSMDDLAYDSGGVTGYKVSSPDMTSPGNKTITVSYKPDTVTFTQTFTIEIAYGSDWDGVVNNVTVTGRNLLTVLGVSTIQEAWEILHQRINADGLSNYHGLGLGDYLDLTEGLAPAYYNDWTLPAYEAFLQIPWNADVQNLRLMILGFNIFKGKNGVTKNHIVWGFKNLAFYGHEVAGSTPTVNLISTETNTDGLAMAFNHTLGGDYILKMSRCSIGNNAIVRQLKVWVPTSFEMWGEIKQQGASESSPAWIPYYSLSEENRKKRYNGDAAIWTLANSPNHILYVNQNGQSSYGDWSTRGLAIHFCQI